MTAGTGVNLCQGCCFSISQIFWAWRKAAGLRLLNLVIHYVHQNGCLIRHWYKIYRYKIIVCVPATTKIAQIMTMTQELTFPMLLPTQASMKPSLQFYIYTGHVQPSQHFRSAWASRHKFLNPRSSNPLRPLPFHSAGFVECWANSQQLVVWEALKAAVAAMRWASRKEIPWSGI